MTQAARIGVIEDSREDFLTLERILDPEVELHHWSSAEQALAALGDGGLQDVELIMVDCGLPGQDGVDLVHQLREAPGGRRAKIAMLSGERNPAVARQAMDAGADRFAYKGSSLEEYKAAVNACLLELRDPKQAKQAVRQ